MDSATAPAATTRAADAAVLDKLYHGGDYNPEQWADVPGIFEQDLRLMKLARLSAATVGVFSWASLEPEEGRYTFDWLDRVIDGLSRNGQRIVLATPSGAKPNWLALKYEEVRRVDAQGRREPQQGRHNFCWTSPVYRQKVRAINAKLAERYGRHEALLMWHLSNEYGNGGGGTAYCYCPLCFGAFREWLRQRYGTVEKMNAAFWSKFWSHTYASFHEVTHIDPSVHGLDLAWKRFMTDRVISMMADEAAPLREVSPGVPITTNFMGTFPPFDYWRLVESLDVASWDAYPSWHGDAGDLGPAVTTAFTHDIYRSFKGGKPWVLMESTPSQTNWQRVSRLKRPGMHRLASLQAVAHGADGVMYFQFRQSRGSSEKFHGAVVAHSGHENTRVFRDVAQVGADLEKLAPLAGATTSADVAILYDWQNNWGINQAQLVRNADKDYLATCVAHYRTFWNRGIPVDAIDSLRDFSRYKLLVAPMLYMIRPGVAERLEAFVAGGGTLLTTYLSGLVDEEDLAFLGGFPGPASMRKVLGIWVEETDALDERQRISVLPASPANPLRLPDVTRARHFCDIVHLEGAEALAAYGDDFYAGSPAVTVNKHGRGRAYYVASRNDDAFLEAMTKALVTELKIERALPVSTPGGAAGGAGEALPAGVTVQKRVRGDRVFWFAMNFNAEAKLLALASEGYRDALADREVKETIELPPFGVVVLSR